MRPLPYSLKLLALLLIAPAASAEVPSFAEVQARYRSSEGRLLDRNGGLLQEIRLRRDGRALEWTRFGEVSPAFFEALVHVEDRRFYEHGGVDFRAVAGSLFRALGGQALRGASTLSMQLVKLLGDETRPRRSFWDKLRQARLARELESKWTKTEILEGYANIVGFRGEQRGVAAAARALFGKSPHGLDRRESYLLATLLQSPGASPERLAARLCAFSREKDFGDCESLSSWARSVLAAPKALLRRDQLAPHLARKLLSPERAEVRSSLDLALQRFAIETVEEQLGDLAARNVRDAAVVAVENRTGRVLVYVGGSGRRSASSQVDMAEARRQAGSTLKPFLYAAAFERGILTPDSWLLDEPLELAMERGSYRPGNYDGGFHGPVRASQSLASSLNVPAVRVYELLGGEPFHASLVKAGLTGLEPPGHYGPSLALGTADVALLELVNAYRTLANGGVWSPLRFTDAPAGETRRVFSRRTAGMISAILSDRESRALSFGWESVLATPFPAAVKTGTSKDMRDNWCLGYTSDFTVGVWVGNAGGDPMWQVSGISGAAPVWRAVLAKLQAGRKPEGFPFPPKMDATFARPLFARIRYPQHGAILALDPDIPDSRELVPLEAEGGGRFFVDGEPASDLWAPVRGMHKISLRRGDELLDEVEIEVR